MLRYNEELQPIHGPTKKTPPAPKNHLSNSKPKKFSQSRKKRKRKGKTHQPKPTVKERGLKGKQSAPNL